MCIAAQDCAATRLRTTIGFNVDDIARQHLLFLKAVIDCGIKFELLGALDSLQAYDHMRDDFAVPACLHTVYICQCSLELKYDKIHALQVVTLVLGMCGPSPVLPGWLVLSTSDLEPLRINQCDVILSRTSKQCLG